MKMPLLPATFAMVLLAALPTLGQLQCTTVGKQTNCTDWNAVGQNIGNGFAIAAERRHQSAFCFNNPDQAYRGTPCNQLALQVQAQWVADHPKCRQSPANAQAMLVYMEANKLNPWDYGSYNKAFKALKKAHQIELNR